jgi:threonine/homoserine/homoserine lactone efflux protein
MTILFLKGLVFGFLLAASVGPMWVLCFRRTIEQGVLAGFVSGLGVAVADGLYGAVAAFGLTAISGFLLEQSFWLGVIGGVFLLYLGVKCLISKPVTIDESRQERTSLPQAFLSTLGLTLANPPTILAFAAIFAGLGLVSTADYGAASLVVAGVFLGSAFWWVVLAGAANWLRHRIGPGLFRAINIFSGLTILGFAAWQLATILR